MLIAVSPLIGGILIQLLVMRLERLAKEKTKELIALTEDSQEEKPTIGVYFEPYMYHWKSKEKVIYLEEYKNRRK
jgi:hypothetical protein